MHKARMIVGMPSQNVSLMTSFKLRTAIVRPNDENGNRPTSERPFRVLLIAGSDRRRYDCPEDWECAILNIRNH